MFIDATYNTYKTPTHFFNIATQELVYYSRVLNDASSTEFY